MKRHLKIRGTLSKDKNTVTVEILSMSHFGNEFGNDIPWVAPQYENNWLTNYYKCSFNLPERLSLVSHPWMNPMVTITPSKTLMVCLPFTHTKSINCIFKVKIEHWDSIKKLVKAYNEWGDNQ